MQIRKYIFIYRYIKRHYHIFIHTYLTRMQNCLYNIHRPSISSPFQTPYFEHLKMSDLKQRELEDMMIKVNQIQKFNKKHPELKRSNLNGSLNEKEMFAQLNRIPL